MVRGAEVLFISVLVLLIFGIAYSSEQPPAQSATLQTFNSAAMRFEPNMGQTDARVQFLSRGPGYTLFLSPTEAVFSFIGSTDSDKKAMLSMKFSGADLDVKGTGLEELTGKNHYYYGIDPKKWVTDVPAYARLMFREVYPGIDLVYRGNQRQLEYDFILAPGADPGKILIAFDEVESMEIDCAGNLVIYVAGEKVLQKAPVIYQEKDGVRVSVAGRFALKGKSEIGFEVDDYDTSRPLVIDPELVYSSFFGGSDDDYAAGICVDDSGHVYLAGSTSSVDFPATGSIGPAGDRDVILTKLLPDGSGFDYSLYLGGSGYDSGEDLFIDRVNGHLYLTGVTRSADFPTYDLGGGTPYQTAFNSSGDQDAFLVKLGTDGSLIYSTYLSGFGNDRGYSVALGPNGRIYVAGNTLSDDFIPTGMTGVYNSTRTGDYDLFLAVIEPNGNGSSDLYYATYIGGGGDEGLFAHIHMAVDSQGYVYLTGDTVVDTHRLPYFPTTPDAYLKTPKVKKFVYGARSIFIAKLNPIFSGSSDLVYSTFMVSNPGSENGRAIAVDEFGRVYVTGYCSDKWPTTPGCFDSSYNVDPGADWWFTDASLIVLNPAVPGEAGLEYSTYVGSVYGEYPSSILIEGATQNLPGNVIMAGYIDLMVAEDHSFPTTTDAFKTFMESDPDPDGYYMREGYVTKLAPHGNGEADLIYSTIIGGMRNDVVSGLAIDPSDGTLYAVGHTESDGDFIPNLDPYIIAGGYDLFVLKINFDSGTQPAAPTNLVATAASNSSIELTWVDNADNEEFFEIERSFDGISWPWSDQVVANVTSYSDEGLNANTEYFYRVRAKNSAGFSAFSNIASATTLSNGGGGVFTANMDIPVAAGSIEGTYLDTLEADDIWEGFWEKESGGKPSKRYSYLEHKWTIIVGGGSNPEFYLKADRSAVYGEDDFVFAYSTDDVTYTDMVIVDENTPETTYQKYTFLEALNGTVYIRVKDTDDGAGNTEIDGVRVDHMYIETY